MDSHHVIVVGGGIGGSAAALRAAQHGRTVAWIRGDPGTARASRARYVFNVDNMTGVSGGIVQRKVLELLAGPEHVDAREAVRHVLVDDATSETSVRGLFAMGDMSRHRGGTPSLKQICTAQEYAVRAVQTIDRRVLAARRAGILEGTR